MKKFLLSTFVLLLTAFSLFAQVTTSSLTGTVRDEKETLIGASVKATHTPTGTVYGASTSADGRFSISNMRVGGPYTITVSYVGYQSQNFSNVSLKLGEPYVLNVTLAAGNQLNEVVVTAANPRAILNADRTGSTTNIGRAEMQNIPSISRSVNDLTKLTPQANGASIGGGNYRQNNFTVDGSDFNNQFGIGGNLPANGSPISLDALEEISINVTPYDARQSGFVGSAINAVTRSGRNTFFGSAFYNYRDESFQGQRVNGNNFNLQPLDIKQYGASFGGPIIKNKVFFFANAEFNKETRPGQSKVAATSQAPFGSNPNVARPTATEMNDIRSYLLSRYGYDPGIYEGYSNLSNNDKLLVRLDWNINNNHRFNIRYNQVESKSPSFVSTSTTGSGFNFPNGGGRQTINHLQFKNSNYYQDQNLYSLAAELNSSFGGGKFSNTLRASITHQNDPRSSDSEVFPLVDILKDGQAFTTFGYEPFTYGNLRDVKTYSITDNFTVNLGKHELAFGGQVDLSTTKNGFQRFGTGYYVYDSWASFVNNNNPLNYAITYSLTPGYEQAYPTFKFQQYALYAQDAFSVNEKLKLTAGLRVELPTYPAVPEIQTHPLVANLTFSEGRKFDTGVLPKERLMWSPRFGFNYDVKGDRSLQLRGGSGIFTSKVPFVWIVSQSGDAGLIQFTQTWSGNNVPGPFDPNMRAYLPATPPTAGTSIPSNINAIDPNFRFPQTWKSSLAVDTKLPFGFVGTLEGIYNKDLNVAKGYHVNLAAPTALNVAGYPDNRPMYPSSTASKYLNPINRAGQTTGTTADPANQRLDAVVLDNAKDGHSWFVTAKLDKTFRAGFAASVAYTASGQKALYDGSGDQLFNTWSLTQTTNTGNDPGLSYTSFNAPHRVVANLSYRKEFLENLATSISVFYEGLSQGRFSYTYSSDFNRDGVPNDLIYIPKDASEITFVNRPASSSTGNVAYTAQQQSDLFFAYIEQDDYLKSRKGQYAERNGAKMPWRNQFDVRLTQEVFKNLGKTKNNLQFTVDILNVGNLLNTEWGTVNFVNNSAVLVPQNVNALTPGGTTKPTFWLNTFNNKPVERTFGTSETISSTYYMQLGLRYSFQ
jgi:outer membrane receptor protein involved in Fe transport